jgi:hypothetical protein
VTSVARAAIGTALLLLVPLIAMQLTREVNWTLSDFAIMGALLFSAGLLFDLVVTKVRDNTRRIILGAAVVAAFLYVWAELAVGIFTNWGS